ncbi:MAG: MFS transporter [Flavobacteriaceae bacterium]|jgi:nucleoside transporter|nr:MFS transporter [Flavobacteriaceae bacterium]
MNTKIRLIVMNFLQFFVWGAWMMTLGSYGLGEKGWNGAEFGLVFSTMGFASLIMPTLFGILADKWNAKYVYTLSHLLFGLTMCFLPMIATATAFFWVLLLAMCFYMPTLALNNSIGFGTLKQNGKDPVKDFPPIRVFGTVGFIAAMWLTNLVTKKGLLFENPSIAYSFYIAAFGAICLSLFAFTMLPSINKKEIETVEKQSWIDQLGLRAFVLFKQKKMAIFFIFSLLLGGALQLTNAYGDRFLADENIFDASGLINKFSTIILSVSQISETLFILAIPFFMKKFGIKKVMLMSMFAWVFRFGLFGLADNSVLGFVLIISSCIIYGMAFDFFNISGALFVEQNTNSKIQSSAQGVFMLMTNGIGAVLGNLIAGWIIAIFFTSPDNIMAWQNIWFIFAAYALVVAVLFMILFKYKNNPEGIRTVTN